jgi:hypothetical protein
MDEYPPDRLYYMGLGEINSKLLAHNCSPNLALLIIHTH